MKRPLNASKEDDTCAPTAAWAVRGAGLVAIGCTQHRVAPHLYGVFRREEPPAFANNNNNNKKKKKKNPNSRPAPPQSPYLLVEATADVRQCLLSPWAVYTIRFKRCALPSGTWLVGGECGACRQAAVVRATSVAPPIVDIPLYTIVEWRGVDVPPHPPATTDVLGTSLFGTCYHLPLNKWRMFHLNGHAAGVVPLHHIGVTPNEWQTGDALLNDVVAVSMRTRLALACALELLSPQTLANHDYWPLPPPPPLPLTDTASLRRAAKAKSVASSSVSPPYHATWDGVLTSARRRLLRFDQHPPAFRGQREAMLFHMDVIMLAPLPRLLRTFVVLHTLAELQPLAIDGAAGEDALTASRTLFACVGDALRLSDVYMGTEPREALCRVMPRMATDVTYAKQHAGLYAHRRLVPCRTRCINESVSNVQLFCELFVHGVMPGGDPYGAGDALYALMFDGKHPCPILTGPNTAYVRVAARAMALAMLTADATATHLNCAAMLARIAAQILVNHVHGEASRTHSTRVFIDLRRVEEMLCDYTPYASSQAAPSRDIRQRLHVAYLNFVAMELKRHFPGRVAVSGEKLGALADTGVPRTAASGDQDGFHVALLEADARCVENMVGQAHGWPAAPESPVLASQMSCVAVPRWMALLDDVDSARATLDNVTTMGRLRTAIVLPAVATAPSIAPPARLRLLEKTDASAMPGDDQPPLDIVELAHAPSRLAALPAHITRLVVDRAHHVQSTDMAILTAWAGAAAERRVCFVGVADAPSAGRGLSLMTRADGGQATRRVIRTILERYWTSKAIVFVPWSVASRRVSPETAIAQVTEAVREANWPPRLLRTLYRLTRTTHDERRRRLGSDEHVNYRRYQKVVGAWSVQYVTLDALIAHHDQVACGDAMTDPSPGVSSAAVATSSLPLLHVMVDGPGTRAVDRLTRWTLDDWFAVLTAAWPPLVVSGVRGATAREQYDAWTEAILNAPVAERWLACDLDTVVSSNT